LLHGLVKTEPPHSQEERLKEIDRATTIGNEIHFQKPVQLKIKRFVVFDLILRDAVTIIWLLSEDKVYNLKSIGYA